MKGRFYSFLIILPALMVVAAGAWLVLTYVPKAIATEPSRIGREYRAIAEDLAQNPGKQTSVGDRQKGWRQVGKIDGSPWGYVVHGDRATVWLQTATHYCRAVEVDTIKPFPYVLVFYVGGSVAFVVLLSLAAFSLVCFRRFMRERDDFLAATAHDLTTPLVGMRYMIGRNDDEARRLVERLLVIVGNIRDFLCLGGRSRPSEPKPLNLVALCREAYALFAEDYRDLFDGKDVEIAISTDGDVRCPSVRSTDGDVRCPSEVWALADETLVMQILWNLFGNDLKYAAPYGRVAVRVFQRGDRAVVEFVDEGVGMTPRQRRRCFDRYYRARTVLEAGKGGFGIGLCTAREFARAMGGDLSVRANEPRGCIFTLSLPAKMG